MAFQKRFTTQCIHGRAKNQKPKELHQLKINTIHHCRRNLSETEAYQKKRQHGAHSCGSLSTQAFRTEAYKSVETQNVKPLLITKVLN